MMSALDFLFFICSYMGVFFALSLPVGVASEKSTSNELRQAIIDGEYTEYIDKQSATAFRLTNNMIWKNVFPTSPHPHLTLGKGEIFDGQGYTIYLNGTTNWQGLIKVSNDVTNFADAPLIKNLHMKGGRTSIGGGFIVQSQQKFFMVDSCTSTGIIYGQKHPFHGGGGITGEQCGANGGQALVINCHTSGPTEAADGGGICGRKTGSGGTVNITSCSSSGAIAALSSGGIVGSMTPGDGGIVFIEKCFSTGTIEGPGGCGGLTGHGAGTGKNSLMLIQRSFSTGKISGKESGGICGRHAGQNSGKAEIKDCYSLGRIDVDTGGGICGHYTAISGGTVVIERTFSNGTTVAGAGGVIGSVAGNSNSVRVELSVYRGEQLVGGGTSSVTGYGNSANINDVFGKLHCVSEGCWNNDTWKEQSGDVPVLRFQLATSTPTPSPSSSPIPSFSASSSISVTGTHSGTQTATISSSVSRTHSPTATTASPSASETWTATVSPSVSATWSETVTPRTPSYSRTVTLTPTMSASRTSSPVPVMLRRSEFRSTPVNVSFESFYAAVIRRYSGEMQEKVLLRHAKEQSLYVYSFLGDELTATFIQSDEMHSHPVDTFFFRIRWPVGGPPSTNAQFELLGQYHSALSWTTPFPGERRNSMMWANPISKKCEASVFLYGGWKFSNRGDRFYLNDMWLWSGFAFEWQKIKQRVRGSRPTTTRISAVTWTCDCETVSVNYMFGGVSSTGEILDNMWHFNSDFKGTTVSWEQQDGEDFPSGRYNADVWTFYKDFTSGATAGAKDVYVFGGIGLSDETKGPEYLQDLWRFRCSSKAWKPILTPFLPHRIHGVASALVISSVPLEYCVYVFKYSQNLTFWSFDTYSEEWTNLQVGHLPKLVKNAFSNRDSLLVGSKSPQDNTSHFTLMRSDGTVVELTVDLYTQ
eukprot:gb/GECG01008816.1/.p1 GENE.gb/GECG01008816.1/~~gb/GECG01008816.1/.p1  ORF type:complete len:927 (+),score=68.81 gb/GECG01008816.1/:1-2781(+)